MSLPNIDLFKAQLLRGGARANYFKVTGANIGGDDFSFLCRAASLPAGVVNVVEVMTPGGRKLKLSGERTFENWSITVYNDTDMKMRTRFESWQQVCAGYNTPLAYDTISQYASAQEWKVQQLDRVGKAMRTYQFFDVWPTNIAAIDLNYDEQSSIEEFTVEMAFSYYVPLTTSGSAGVGTSNDPAGLDNSSFNGSGRIARPSGVGSPPPFIAAPET